DALLVTADLQGREAVQDGWGRLLGEALPEYCQELSRQGMLPPLERVGAILGGDFFTHEQMHKRGGSGPVGAVFKAFANHFKFVIAVAGNHDVLPDFKTTPQAPNLHILDGRYIELDGLKIAGISGVVGNPKKPFRRTEDEFAKAAMNLANRQPDFLVMHDGPDGNAGQLGWPLVRAALEQSSPTLIIRGHAYWDSPLATLRNDTQIINCDSRVIIMQRAH
ncbi:MAG: metallophosphoesterase, partial [Verrucomicrobiota bacterium]